ncbi:MAG: NAD-dependent epimerase/dehydratase family protein [Verrucomicrobiaceae bacterium]|nr:NAD-dependent epimerase/dehydratase family protein [Verrucomicrobiaceae bacterium]
MSESYFHDDAGIALDGVPRHLLQDGRVLLTGASGVVGIHMAAAFRRLIDEGSKLRLRVTFQSPVTGVVAQMLDHPQIEIIRGDLTDPSFRRGLDQAEFILHAAGYGQPGRFLENPSKTIRLNTEATLDLLEKVPQGGRFLFVSTSELYVGLPAGEPNREDKIGSTNTTHPRACYIEGKRCGEAACNAARSAGIQAVSARLALAYGPGARPDDRRVLYTFIEKAIKLGEIAMMDHGEARRVYCYAPDAVRIMLRAALEGREPVYNVGGRGVLLIREVAEKIGAQLGVPVKLPETAKPLEGAPAEVGIDMGLFEREFGRLKYVDFDEGLRRTIAWHRRERPAGA